MTFQNTATHERRVRQIYDSLDSGNPKKAIQEADKLLKKQKDATDAKALKALAYIRLCRFKECGDILDELENEIPSDDATLHALSLCFRELNKPNDLSRILEKANQKFNTEELMTNLYFSYVRTQDYKKQYNVALSLYKNNQNNKNKRIYLHWAVVSLILQALMDTDKAKIIYLPLAQKMITKSTPISNLANQLHPSFHGNNNYNNLNPNLPPNMNLTYGDNKTLNEIELDLMSIILELSQKWDEALKLYTSPSGSRIRYSDVPAKEKIAQTYHKMGNFEMANQSYQELIKENPDNWNLYQKLLDTCFMVPDVETFKDYLDHFRLKKSVHQRHRILCLIGTNVTNEGERGATLLDTIMRIEHFLNGVIEWSKNKMDKQLFRAPYMCKIDLSLRCKLLNLTYPPVNSEYALQEYLTKFGDKPCCFADLEYFLCVDELKNSVMLPKTEELVSWLQNVGTVNHESVTEIKCLDRILNRFYNYYKLKKYLEDVNDDLTINRDFFKDFCKTHQELALRLSLTLFDITRCLPKANVLLPHLNDQLVYIACDVMFDLWLTAASNSCFISKNHETDDKQPGSNSFIYLKLVLILAEHALNPESWTTLSKSDGFTNSKSLQTSADSHSPTAVGNSLETSNESPSTTKGKSDIDSAMAYAESGGVSPQLRLALIKIYYLIGAPAMCIEHFHHLDAKFIQFDTIGNYLIYSAFAYAHFTSLKTCFENIIKFYENSYKNIWDYSVTVVKVNFFQIYDFVDFKRRLTFSLIHQFITVEAIILDLITEANNYRIVHEILETVPLTGIQVLIDDWDKLCDNTDYYIVDNYESNRRLNYEDQITVNTYQEKHWILLRNRILVALTLASFISSKSGECHHLIPSALIDTSIIPNCESRTKTANKLLFPKNILAPSGQISSSNTLRYDLETLFKSQLLTLVDILFQRKTINEHFNDSQQQPQQQPNSDEKSGDPFQKFRLFGPISSHLPIYDFANGIYLSPIIYSISICVIVNFFIFRPIKPHSAKAAPKNNDITSSNRENVCDAHLDALVHDFNKNLKIDNDPIDKGSVHTLPQPSERLNPNYPSEYSPEMLKNENLDDDKFYQIVEHMLFSRQRIIDNENTCTCCPRTKTAPAASEDNKATTKTCENNPRVRSPQKVYEEIGMAVLDNLNLIKATFEAMFMCFKEENTFKLPKMKQRKYSNGASDTPSHHHNLCKEDVTRGFPVYFNYDLPTPAFLPPSKFGGTGDLPNDKAFMDENFIINTSSKIYHLRFACETFSLTSLFLGCTYRVLQPLNLKLSKKANVKKKGTIPTPTNFGDNKLNSNNSSRAIIQDFTDILNFMFEEIRNFLVFLHSHVAEQLVDIIKHVARDLNSYFDCLQNMSTSVNESYKNANTDSGSKPGEILKEFLDPINILKLNPQGTFTIFDDDLIKRLLVPPELVSKISESYQKSFCELNKVLFTTQNYLSSILT